ncbi:phage tail assembly protein T [Photobacterium atrarenae]|uniref:Phage tail assembly protein T n=1 Tax=Photobacterium atrarenae TaxID=865757 RepID=A0ABY5GII5_9GAMM|nr:phage tail assembly protein T [Photobacterium atrarenae]UTV29001.1 phage tail assembly protein T [Photobacterium atrarenae]
MLASISAETVLEWRRYFVEHGFTHEMDNWRAAMATAANWNVTALSAGIKMDEPMSLKNFLPSTGEPEPPREYTDDELMDLGASAGGMRFECPDS